MAPTTCDGCGLGYAVCDATFEGVGEYGGRVFFMALCYSCVVDLPSVLNGLGVLAMTAGACIPAAGRPAATRRR